LHVILSDLKYYLIAGEASGDLHGSNLVKQLKKFDSESVFYGWGGDLMIAQGVQISKHIRDLAFMGLVEVLANLKTIKRNFKLCKEDILNKKPDVLILVDYPGFNLRMAKWAKSNGIKVFYYISPTVWAWHQSRVEQVRKFVDKMFCIIPFEKDFYKKFNIEVEYEGHPLLDAIEDFRKTKLSRIDFCRKNNLSDKPIIAIVPGSRKQEIKRKLPVMLSVVKYFPDYQFVITGAPAINKEFYQLYLDNSEIPILFNQTYDVLENAHSAIVTSGTASVETALFSVPQVVCYKTAQLTFILAKLLVSVKYISLVNLILNRLAICELIQNDLTHDKLLKEVKAINTGEKRDSIIKEYQVFNEMLGGSGASERIAGKMVEILKGWSK
jgi:lipid-A-disaccharide synthase